MALGTIKGKVQTCKTSEYKECKDDTTDCNNPTKCCGNSPCTMPPKNS